jgi:hypothetical protein
MDLNYLLYRQQVERSRSVSATSAPARAAHAQLATLYEDAIAQVTSGRLVALVRNGIPARPALVE